MTPLFSMRTLSLDHHRVVAALKLTLGVTFLTVLIITSEDDPGGEKIV